MKNEAKYELNEKTGKYDVLYRGFSYMTFTPYPNWHKIFEVDTEDEAKKKCSDCLDFDD